MSFFQVTPRELRNKAGKLSELNSRFKAKQQELTEQESALCSMWEGGARDTFHQAFTRWAAIIHSFICQYVAVL